MASLCEIIGWKDSKRWKSEDCTFRPVEGAVGVGVHYAFGVETIDYDVEGSSGLRANSMEDDTRAWVSLSDM